MQKKAQIKEVIKKNIEGKGVKNITMKKNDKLKLISLVVKSLTGVLGGSLILTEQHPYLSLATLAIGAAANEVISFLKDK